MNNVTYNEFATTVKNEVQIMDYEQQLGILTIIVSAMNNGKKTSPAEKFLKLSWEGNESAEEVLSIIENNRVNSNRFGTDNGLFD